MLSETRRRIKVKEHRTSKCRHSVKKVRKSNELNILLHSFQYRHFKIGDEVGLGEG